MKIIVLKIKKYKKRKKKDKKEEKDKKRKSKITWKRRYYNSLYDQKREIISEEELHYFQWRFQFHNGWIPGIYRASFTRTNALIVPGLQGHDEDEEGKRWRFVDKRSKGILTRFVQVNEYTPLRVSRLKDWGWQLLNAWVLMTSVPPGTVLDDWV